MTFIISRVSHASRPSSSSNQMHPYLELCLELDRKYRDDSIFIYVTSSVVHMCSLFVCVKCETFHCRPITHDIDQLIEENAWSPTHTDTCERGFENKTRHSIVRKIFICCCCEIDTDHARQPHAHASEWKQQQKTCWQKQEIVCCIPIINRNVSLLVSILYRSSSSSKCENEHLFVSFVFDFNFDFQKAFADRWNSGKWDSIYIWLHAKLSLIINQPTNPPLVTSAESAVLGEPKEEWEEERRHQCSSQRMTLANDKLDTIWLYLRQFISFWRNCVSFNAHDVLARYFTRSFIIHFMMSL